MASVSIFKQKNQSEAGTIHWLNECIKRGQREIFSEVVDMNPGLAAELLRRNPDNRYIKPTKVQHFAKDMIGGRWVFNGEPVIISDDGLVNDGQHRLQAIIEANLVQPTICTFGVTRASRTTVDQGSARGAADYLQMDGIHYAHNAATAAKFIIAYERSDGRNITQRAAITNSEVVARVKADEAIIASAAYAHHHLKSYRHLVSHTVMCVCHYLFSDINEKDAKTFLDQVGLGENIKRGDPAFAVRTAFLSDKRERQEAMEVIFHGWNKFRSGQSLKQVKCNGSLPALI